MSELLQYILYLVILVALAIPLGKYISKVLNGEHNILTCICQPCENFIYRLLNINANEDMHWKQYAKCAVIFSAVNFAVLFAILILQQYLPFNPQNISGNSWHLAFNTTSSFITNTNWQSYSGESTLSYFSQAIGLTVQNFVSAAVGIAVLFAFIRGFMRVQQKGIGSFWVDVTRSVLYIMLPLCFVLAISLVSQGVMQNLQPYQTVDLLEPIHTENGLVTQAVIPMGPQASQVAPKQLGTNGGGYNGTNSASPLENPNPLSNLLQMTSILLIPAALCFTFGHSINDLKQGKAIFAAMFLMLVIALAVIGINEGNATPQLAAQGSVDISNINQAGGNMEGKETRFGIATSATWAAYTTAASNGSVNSMHDSYTPLGGMMPMLLMQLGEVVFGGVGCGLYGMIGFVIMTVFIVGLMVGRTPEYLGKKIEPYEMKMAVLVCLATPIAILVSSGIASAVPIVADSLNNSGAHGFSELLYTFTSAGGNNGSAFAGFNANTPFLNVSIGLTMLFARFLPMMAALAIAGSMAQKRKVATSAGTLSTSNTMFVVLLILIVLMIGALSFLPALALGPIADYLQMIH